MTLAVGRLGVGLFIQAALLLLVRSGKLQRDGQMCSQRRVMRVGCGVAKCDCLRDYSVVNSSRCFPRITGGPKIDDLGRAMHGA